MRAIVNQEPVIIFKAEGAEEGVFAAVPTRLISYDCELDINAYAKEGWAEGNNAFQKIPRGSEVWPDMNQPANEDDEGISEFADAIGAK